MPKIDWIAVIAISLLAATFLVLGYLLDGLAGFLN
jgi:hypothetical protein